MMGNVLGVNYFRAEMETGRYVLYCLEAGKRTVISTGWGLVVVLEARRHLKKVIFTTIRIYTITFLFERSVDGDIGKCDYWAATKRAGHSETSTLCSPLESFRGGLQLMESHPGYKILLYRASYGHHSHKQW